MIGRDSEARASEEPSPDDTRDGWRGRYCGWSAGQSFAGENLGFGFDVIYPNP